MRIVGGEFRGRTLYAFEGEDIRPTPDKVREALFNILQNRIYGVKFLDLFAGSGAMGIEALSRGAKKVVFNDKDKKSVALVKKNLEKLKIDTGFEVVNQDGVLFVSSAREKFDIIYIDPPYKAGLNELAVSASINSLEKGGLIILESEQPFEGEIEGLKVADTRKYGRVILTFFQIGE